MRTRMHAESISNYVRETVPTMHYASVSDTILARDTVEAFGNLKLACAEDLSDWDKAYDDNIDNEFWKMLDAAGACMHGLTIVSGIDNWQDLLALLTRLRKWDWCAWILEHHEELGLAPGDGVYEEFEKLA